MRKAAMIAVILVLALPAIVLSAAAGTEPDWFSERIGGVPGVVWFVMAWFAAMTLASWVPFDRDRAG